MIEICHICCKFVDLEQAIGSQHASNVTHVGIYRRASNLSWEYSVGGFMHSLI